MFIPLWSIRKLIYDKRVKRGDGGGAPLALLARYECVKNLKQAGYVEIDDKRRKAPK